jgi:two-component system, OmpR family, response regulator
VLIEKILLVDDDANIRLIAQIGLEDVPDWCVIEACGGAEALRKAGSEKPDLILLDMMMPDMDGKTTLARLKADGATAHIPVIFMTAKVQSHEIASYRALGVAGVISKPFDPVTLSDEIRRITDAL